MPDLILHRKVREYQLDPVIPTLFSDLLQRPLTALLVASGYDDGGPHAGPRRRRSLADARGPAGDEDYLAAHATVNVLHISPSCSLKLSKSLYVFFNDTATT